jgi:type IV secretory pathway TrbL component
MRKLLIAGFIASFSLMTSLPAAAATEATEASANAAIATAAKAQKKAARKHAEWRDIKKFLKKAGAAVKSGDYDKATKLAKKATFQAKMGIQQAAEQKNAGPLF